MPVQCHIIGEVSCDVSLLEALSSHRADLGNKEWGRWQNALFCFNQANSDSGDIGEQMEWVLLCGAFEQILDAKSKAADVATKFSQCFVPAKSLPTSGMTRQPRPDNGQSLRYQWMREFYTIRGAFAHGKPATQQRVIWNSSEHLVLATIAFPLMVKSLLASASKYTLTDDDHARMDSFEAFADTVDFLKRPDNQGSSRHFPWTRLVGKRKSDIVSRRAAEQAWKGLKPEDKKALKEAAERIPEA